MQRNHAASVLLGALALLFGTACSGTPDPVDGGSTDDAAVDSGPEPVCATDAECDDGLFCNGSETCEAGQCVAGDAETCDDGIECTVDSCDEARRECTHDAPDADRDGVLDAACLGVDGLPLGRDCDDSDPDRYPGNTEICDDGHDEDCDPTTFGYRDLDSDGYPDSRCCNVDAEGTSICGDDCNDARSTVHPGNAEICDGDDNDCDMSTDEGVLRTFYVDMDSDGRGDSTMATMAACFPPSMYAEIGGDCDDTRSAVHPGAPEVCDAAMLDEDCDGTANPAALCTCSGSDTRACLAEGACRAGVERCSEGLWGACSIAPVAEVCNGIDDDCDGVEDEGLRIVCYDDPDDDGYAASGATSSSVCPVGGRAAVGGCPIGSTNREPLAPNLDCDEGVDTTHPFAAELCNAVNDDCDGAVDEGLPLVVRYIDMDGDGRQGAPVNRCEGDPGSVPASLDCNEMDTSVYVGAIEICDRIDNNCSLGGAAAGGVDVFEDQDGDGYAPTDALCTGGPLPKTDCNDSRASDNPGATEVCSGYDTDCDGTVDEDPEAYASCVAADASAGCAMDGTCRIFACDAGFGDCNGTYADGCEVDLTTDEAHCGGCGYTCGAEAPCLGGLCDRLVAIRAGYRRSCLIFESGAMSCTGEGNWGELGDGSRTDRSTHVAVRNMTGAVDASHGQSHVCAARADGTVACWGRGSEGQHGDGVFEPWSGLPRATSGIANALEIASGASFNCALRSTGGVSCWGAALSGLGDAAGTTVSGVPIAVSGLTDAVAIGAYANSACAVRSGGGVVCWGRNLDGQLGDGTTTNSPTPIAVVGVTNAVDVAVGDRHACALLGDQTVVCWGSATNGRLGDGTMASTVRTATPVLTGSGTLGGVTALAVGVDHSCVLRAGGQVSCWGDNSAGALGNGTAGGNVAFATDVSGVSGQDEVVAWTASTCARAGTQVTCWGRNDVGQLGMGDLTNRSSPEIVPGLARVAEPAMGNTVACARRTDGDLACWGENGYGQLGQGTTTGQSWRPRPVPGLVTRAADAGLEMVCAVEVGGTVRCWGRGSGLGPTGTPTLIAGLTDVVDFRTGYLTRCVLHATGAMSCWGDNSSGQVGDNTTTTRTAPVPVMGLTDVHTMAVGRSHTCAIERDGHLYCWGWNNVGQLGVGDMDAHRVPTLVPFFDDFVDVAVGHGRTCALRATNQLYCWGNLRTGTTATPVEITLPAGRVASLDVSDSGSICAALDVPPPTPGRPLLCWNSDNSAGQMGVNTFTPVDVPTQVHTYTDFDAVQTGDNATCAPRDGRRSLACWGAGLRIGDGTGTTASTPQTVVDFP